jgi:hypothetical protein
MKPHPNTVVSEVSRESIASEVFYGNTLAGKPAVVIVEKEYWKLNSRYQQAMNNCT